MIEAPGATPYFTVLRESAPEGLRTILDRAREKARSLNHFFLSREHLLAVLGEEIKENEGVAGRSIKSLRSSLDLSSEVKLKKARSPQVPLFRTDFSVTPVVTQLIGLASEEARRLGHRHVGSEHLLLAFCREAKEKGGDFFGLDLSKLRDTVFEESNVEERTALIKAATEIAEKLHHPHVDTEHLLIALLNNATRNPDSAVSQILGTLGINLHHLNRTIRLVVERGEKTLEGNPLPTEHITNIFERAGRIAQKLESAQIRSEHILIGLCEEGGLGATILNCFDIHEQRLQEETAKLGKSTSPK